MRTIDRPAHSGTRPSKYSEILRALDETLKDGKARELDLDPTKKPEVEAARRAVYSYAAKRGVRGCFILEKGKYVAWLESKTTPRR